MRQLDPGTIKAPPLPWWHGTKFQCPECNTEWELEKGDPVERQQNGAIITFTCTVCDAQGQITRPEDRYRRPRRRR